VNERVHGGLHPHHLVGQNLEASQVLDFSVNLNPYGPCVPVRDAARSADLTEYPDPKARTAREAWAGALQTSPERVVVGQGACDLLWAVVRAFVNPGERVTIAEPTFSELRVACAQARADVVRVFTPDPELRLDLSRFADESRGARLAYVCAPNNPTGEGISLAKLRTLAEAIAPTFLIVDQSFLSLSDQAHEAHGTLPDNAILLRSLTKDYALAGLRIGYLLAAPELAERVEDARPTWATSAPALAAIARAAEEQAFVRASWQRMREDREYLRSGLRALGARALPGVSGYSLVHVGEAPRVVEELLQRGIFVRDASSFGLPEHVRIAARPRAETERLLEAWASLRLLA
jgi:histidinol-phosphate/aromatic aminotransferase/cobyric acid decarboxylase-like protein